jgi:hypothetical protein
VPSASAIDPHAYVTCVAGCRGSRLGTRSVSCTRLVSIDRSASPNTVGLLDARWKRLAGHLDAVPAAFHRLLESIAHVAEALWMQALDAGRRRAGAADGGSCACSGEGALGTALARAGLTRRRNGGSLPKSKSKPLRNSPKARPKGYPQRERRVNGGSPQSKRAKCLLCQAVASDTQTVK